MNHHFNEEKLVNLKKKKLTVTYLCLSRTFSEKSEKEEAKRKFVSREKKKT